MVLFPYHTGTSTLVGAAQVSALLIHSYRAEAWQVILVSVIRGVCSLGVKVVIHPSCDQGILKFQ